ncbi:MAG: cell division cycle- protein [Phylliscum demangeonii]|nr:MAG: cell division cycle- protein [Phylliscum demangeonii]
MQGPCLLAPWALRPDPSLGRPSFADRAPFGPNSFNFKELSMKPAPTDYFTLKPLRGSSPSASLAADLSQNCHIDQSPQIVTPRRSLFTTSTLFGKLEVPENTTTPPLPSSSPGPGVDSMDISPLPHKAPFGLVTQVVVESPPLQPTPTNPPTMVGLDGPRWPTGDPPRDHLAPERRKPPFFPRPSLIRAKGNSTSGVSFKTTGSEAKLPPFRFGGVRTSSTLTLGECFTASPPHARKTSAPNPTTGWMAVPRPKPPFAPAANTARTGSPMSGHVRKPSVPGVRPRKLFRRSLSMFEHPDDVVREKTSFVAPALTLQAIMDVEEPYQRALPHFIPDDQPDSLPRISQETLIAVLDGAYASSYEQAIVVDCRFEYEYDGGHIQGAVNYNDKELLASKLFEASSPARTLLIFHCEYSAHRAPIMATFIRGHDRSINDHRYPALTYPEVYILHGGYSAFFRQHQSRCFPPSYVEMHSKDHVNTCEREMGKLRNRKKLSRAQTFAFGEQGQGLDESPTVPGRHLSDASVLGACLMRDDTPRRSARRMPSC